MLKTNELADAIVRKIHGQATVEDIQLIDQWLRADKGNEILYQKLLRDEDKVLDLLQRVDSSSALLRLKRRASTQRRQRWTKVAIAASALALAGLFFIDRNSTKRQPAVAQRDIPSGTIQPASQRAMLLMADGKEIWLDGSLDTTFSNGSVKMQQANGTLQYETTVVEQAAAMQELSTPRAGTYHLKLPDGTQVWLNTASKLRFPQQFGTAERTVELFGEGYFEVSKDASRPFRVITDGGSRIEVLGTAFNVKGYQKDEVTTTLLEGSVKIIKDDQTRLLKVGQAAKVAGTSISIDQGDIPAATAWRQDRFMFHQMAIGEVMDEIARWYDVRLDYEASFRSKQELYTGEIGRDVTLDRLLTMLEETGVARFKLRERTISISPK